MNPKLAKQLTERDFSQVDTEAESDEERLQAIYDQLVNTDLVLSDDDYDFILYHYLGEIPEAILNDGTKGELEDWFVAEFGANVVHEP